MNSKESRIVTTESLVPLEIYPEIYGIDIHGSPIDQSESRVFKGSQPVDGHWYVAKVFDTFHYAAISPATAVKYKNLTASARNLPDTFFHTVLTSGNKSIPVTWNITPIVAAGYAPQRKHIACTISPYIDGLNLLQRIRQNSKHSLHSPLDGYLQIPCALDVLNNHLIMYATMLNQALNTNVIKFSHNNMKTSLIREGLHIEVTDLCSLVSRLDDYHQPFFIS